MLLIVKETEVTFTGLVRVRELPKDCSKEDFEAWWWRAAEAERDRYTVYEHKNLLTVSGRNQILAFIGSQTSGTAPFAQYFAVGTFPLGVVNPNDASVQGELFRAAPSMATVTGTQIDISTYFGASQANGNYTNAGLFGINATSTSGSGTLMTHTLYAYNKANGTPITNDYLINLN